jgi:hypothetical protein
VIALFVPIERFQREFIIDDPDHQIAGLGMMAALDDGEVTIVDARIDH